MKPGNFVIIHDDGLPAHAEIRRNTDGVVRQYSLAGMGGFKGDFIWCEGNFACDCNREIFFCDAIGEEAENETCGSEAYSVRIFADDDHRELYADDDWR